MKISGQCHCGSISFTAMIDPSKVMACHCKDCQTFSGAPFRAVVPAPVETVSMSGTPKLYVKVAESGNRRAQAFCADCGTQLYASEADAPKMLNFRLGSINERAKLAPVIQVWGQSAMPWLHSLFDVPMHSKGLASPLMHVQAATD
jgi:hypothetical protein